MVAPNSSNIYRLPSSSRNNNNGSSGSSGGGHNSTHRLLIEISFFLALIITFYQYHVISIHDLQQHNAAGGGVNDSTEKKVEDILNAVSKIEDRLALLEQNGGISINNNGGQGGGGSSLVKTNNNNNNKEGVVTNFDRSTTQFCGHCRFNDVYTCQQRVEYMMKEYGIVQTVAQSNDLVEERCKLYPVDEPYLLIHAGPHKTGTTSIQTLIYQSESLLKKDNIRIPSNKDLPGIFKDGGGSMLNLAHCMLSKLIGDGGQMNQSRCNELRKGIEPFLKETYENKQNVLIVAEDFDRVKIDFGRLHFYVKPYSRIKVVTAYRRLHDWLPSWYNEIVKLYTVVYFKGEEEYPSLVQWMEEKYDQFKAVHAMAVAQRFRDAGIAESVEVLNMHDETEPNMLDNFFCNYVPGANMMCQAVREGQQPPKSNKGVDHEYDRVAVKASLLKKIPGLDRYNPGRVGAAIKALAKERGLDDNLPSKCLNQTMLDDIFTSELSQEKEYFPKFFESQGGEEGLRQDFEKKKHKFCALDVNLIMERGTFDPIFEELSKDWKF